MLALSTFWLPGAEDKPKEQSPDVETAGDSPVATSDKPPFIVDNPREASPFPIQGTNAAQTY